MSYFDHSDNVYGVAVSLARMVGVTGQLSDPADPNRGQMEKEGVRHLV